MMRPVGALCAGLAVALVVLGAKTIDRGQLRIKPDDVAVELPSDAIWPPPSELRSQLSTATDRQASTSDASNTARQFISERLRSVSPADNPVVLGAIEPVVEDIVKISYQGNGSPVYPGSLHLRALGSTWYVFASENDALHPFELSREGREIAGDFVPTQGGTARLRIHEYDGDGEPLVEREIEVVAERLIPFGAMTRSPYPVVVSVTLSLADGRTALTELTL